jgi:HEAT repeat protein
MLAVRLCTLLWSLTCAPNPLPQDALAQTIRDLLRNPDTCDPVLLEDVASFRTEQALEGLSRLYGKLSDGQRRALLLQCLRYFAATDLEPRALDFLADCVRRNSSPNDVRAACRALTQFEEIGGNVLYDLLREAAHVGMVVGALEQLVGVEREETGLLRQRVLHGAHRTKLESLGLLDKSAWRSLYTELRCREVLRAVRRGGNTRELLPYLEDRNGEVVAKILEALAPLHPEECLQFARESLSHEDGHVVRAAVKVLPRDNDPETVRRLYDQARGRDDEVRLDAIAALQQMNLAPLKEQLLALMTRRSLATDALLALQLLEEDRSAEVCVRRKGLFRHQDPLVKIAAIRSAAASGDQSCLRELRQICDHRDSSLRAAATLAVTQLSPTDPTWREELLRLAATPNASLRWAVAASLGYLSDRQSLPVLHDLLEDRHWRVRAAAVEALARIRSADSIAPLIARLDAERSRLRALVVQALQKISGKQIEGDAREWRLWWARAREGFVVPLQDPAMDYDRGTSRESAVMPTGAQFYGIPVHSDHLILVLDCSGSMAEPAFVTDESGREMSRFEVLQKEVERLLLQLPRETVLNIIFFETHLHALKEKSVQLNDFLISKARRFVQSRFAKGGTNLFGALHMALTDPEIDTIYVLSDGQPTEGSVVDPYLIAEEARRLNADGQLTIHTISIGTQSELLYQLAEDSGGEYVVR